MMEIRKAKPGDEASILRLIQALADYEKSPNEVINTADKLHQDLFIDPCCEAFVALVDNEIIGFALYYFSYSTWKGRCLYLEDFYIDQNQRGKGFGKALFEEVIREARKRNVIRIDWQVLDWNEPAIQFYKQQGADLDPEWINGRLYL